MPARTPVDDLLSVFTVAPCALALMVQGGVLLVFGLTVLATSMIGLVVPEFRRLTLRRVVAGVVASILVLVAGLLMQGTPASHAYGDDSAAAADPSFTPGEAANTHSAELDGKPIDTLLLPDIVSEPVSMARGKPIPPPPDDADVDALSADRIAVELPYVEARPIIDDLPLVTEALAGLRHAASERGGPATKPDTVTFSLTIGVDGRVAGWIVISSTSPAAREAAVAALPYLRYTPALNGGKPVSVWAAQRMVIEP
jgi:hypothetical protein